MEHFLNVALLRNPFNWAIVVLMIALGNLAMQYVFTAAQNAKGA